MGQQGIYFDLDTNLCTWSTELMPWPLKWYGRTVFLFTPASKMLM